MSRRILNAVYVVLGLGMSQASLAATTWTFDIPPPGAAPCSVNGTGYGNNVFCTPVGGGAPTMTATGWANTGGTASATNPTATTIQNAYVAVYDGGLGVRNRGGSTKDPGEGTSPEHAIDNNGTNSTSSTISESNKYTSRYDVALLDFSSAVTLSGVVIGWPSTSSSYDTDITVLAFTGSSFSSASNLAGLSYSQLTSNGWTLVGHYSDLAQGSVEAINGSGISSQYWLIGAYNPTVGNTQNWSIGNDYVKLLSVVGTETSPPAPPGSVPEPASLALLALAAAGALGSQRRRKAR